MLLFNKFILYLKIILFSIILSLILFEFYASYKSDRFPSYGFLGRNVMDDKIKECQKDKNIGVFGDSFTEWFGDRDENIANILNDRFKDHNLCNFGMSGTEITNYIARFLHVLDTNVKLQKAIFFLYEGNDFSEFRYLQNTENLSELKVNKTVVFNYSSKENLLERKPNFIRNFIKSTKSVNIIWREVIKKYFFKNKINEKFVRNIYKENKYFEVSVEKAINRMKNTPHKLKKDITAGIINESFYKLALRNPNYFKEIFDPPKIKSKNMQKIIAYKHIDFINDLCDSNNIDCKFVIIPNDQFLFAQSKDKYVKIFRFNAQDKYGKSNITKNLILKYPNIYYPENILIFEDYIKNDMHLNYKGNIKLADFTYEKFK